MAISPRFSDDKKAWSRALFFLGGVTLTLLLQSVSHPTRFSFAGGSKNTVLLQPYSFIDAYKGFLNQFLPEKSDSCPQNIKPPFEPHMNEGDKLVLHTFMKRAKERFDKNFIYLEWGTGGSTFIAPQYAQHVYAVDNHKKFCDYMANITEIGCLVKQKRLDYFCIDGGPTKTWGHPVNKSTYNSEGYINIIDRLPDPIHVVLIDGRFRVATALKAWDHLHPEGFLMIHDFTDRMNSTSWNYKEILGFYDWVTEGWIPKETVLGVFTKRSNINRVLLDAKLGEFRKQSG